MRARGEVAIPYDGRLLLAVRHRRERVGQAEQLAELAREVGQPLPAARATLPGDRSRLRGIPVVGPGCGAIYGTQPELELMRKEGLREAIAKRLGGEEDLRRDGYHVENGAKQPE